MAAIAGHLLKWDVFLLGCITTRTRKASLDRFLRSISMSADGHAYPALLILLIVLQIRDWPRILLAEEIEQICIKRMRPPGGKPAAPASSASLLFVSKSGLFRHSAENRKTNRSFIL
jgi:hypothetical protein